MGEKIIGLVIGGAFALLVCMGGTYIVQCVRMNRLEKEYEQQRIEIGIKFEERLRELRMEAGINPETGFPEVIDMSEMFQKK